MTADAMQDHSRAGWSQGHLAGRSRANDHICRQEHTLEDQIIHGEDALYQLATVAYQREAAHYSSYRTAPFQRRFIAGWVQGYVAECVNRGKPPLHRKCRACGYVGEDVYVFTEPGSILGRYECASLARCVGRIAARRRQRVRQFGEHVYGY